MAGTQVAGKVGSCLVQTQWVWWAQTHRGLLAVHAGLVAAVVVLALMMALMLAGLLALM